ncbi:Peptidase A1 domain-containing protein [Abeliophyllum distichum]|uniref:Peptidase A1 domain-containing protein n=1 Tax=Abeliophyllum distichum TaxID=126358 RepID=A0ABD1TF28_9LAMI
MILGFKLKVVSVALNLGENCRVQNIGLFSYFTKKCCRKVCQHEARHTYGSSKGFVGTETFDFPSNDKARSYFLRLGIGSGVRNVLSFGMDDDHHNLTAGVFSLGTGRRSFLTQLGKYTNGHFSHCLRHHGHLGKELQQYCIE